MATRPDPTLPVIVNVSSLGVNTPTDFTRVFTIASFGDTNLQAGEVVNITKSTISEAKIKGGSYVNRLVNAYFSNNSQGTVNIIELKESVATPHVHTYLAGDYYVADDNTVKKALQGDKATSESDYKPVNWEQEAYWEETQEVKQYKFGDYYIDFTAKKEYIALKEDAATSLTNLKPSKLTNGNFWKEAESEVTLERAIRILKDFIVDGGVRSYEIACPSEFYKFNSFIDLVKSYSGLTDAQYFSIELPAGTDPSIDTTFKLYNAVQSFVPIIPSQIETESANGIMGIKASTKYDLGENNRLSLLQWKTINGISPLEKVKTKLLDAYNQNGCTWVSDFNKNTVVMGGQCGDGKNWDWHFALDTFIFQLKSQLGTMMLQSANNPQTAIHFNQAGINVIAKKLEAIASQMVSWGVLEEFGADYDLASNTVLETGKWKITDYATYKSNNYAKWQKGIYDGAFVYATIGNFILQIGINLTIE